MVRSQVPAMQHQLAIILSSDWQLWWIWLLTNTLRTASATADVARSDHFSRSQQCVPDAPAELC